MAIPASTLETWSNQGATQTPKSLREKIERKLTGSQSKVQRKNQLEIYLQGSYRNSTNIYGNSDVDVVVQSDATFFSDVSDLDTLEKAIYERAFSEATYTWEDYKSEVIETLEDSFGVHNVEVGNKSIKIDDGTYEADVVPCFEYRKYTSFGESAEEREYIPGIKFYTTTEKRSVVNYPKEHFSKGATKNQRVSMRYKPTIRIFKNFKKKLIEKDMINKEQVPSYFVENLLYNVSDHCYDEPSIATRVYNVLKWLQDNRESMSQFICQNEQIYLFGNSQEQWNEDDARTFINQAITLWNEW
ncbi:nucleotidyltransferase domain-containing protein [Tenuibacillus multivorans]|uniref:Nucleotidyltransferase domain-containing protein n=1 Tax=Tenuibacillus multivorans TaxID=237069 RepID=A0A1H0E3E3_9BACI|nr:nucleotidyltransferase [Tenuibacillus multivorans]GEL76665.1 nucleotidyltransferase [Tenuibacillus multivorans]SDN76997.1 Nucleotidyltransferase domain-containing protein [Tenuibacillus multivorans]